MHELKTGLQYLANDIYGLANIHLGPDSAAHDALVAYAIGAVKLVENIQTDILNNVGRKKIVEFFLQQIPSDACAHAKAKIMEYQDSYYEAEIHGQYLQKYDHWNLFYTTTILIAYLKTFQDHTRNFARAPSKAPSTRQTPNSYNTTQNQNHNQGAHS